MPLLLAHGVIERPCRLSSDLDKKGQNNIMPLRRVTQTLVPNGQPVLIVLWDCVKLRHKTIVYSVWVQSFFIHNLGLISVWLRCLEQRLSVFMCVLAAPAGHQFLICVGVHGIRVAFKAKLCGSACVRRWATTEKLQILSRPIARKFDDYSQLELDAGIMPQDWMMNIRLRAKLISAIARADSCIHFHTTPQVLH